MKEARDGEQGKVIERFLEEQLLALYREQTKLESDRRVLEKERDALVKQFRSLARTAPPAHQKPILRRADEIASAFDGRIAGIDERIHHVQREIDRVREKQSHA